MALSARGLALLALLAVVLSTASTAQISSPSFPGRQVQPVLSRPAAVAPPSDLALEGALDPETYLLGPGDVFIVSIGGSVPRQTTTVVTADGLLVIPEAGTFEAAGRRLVDVRARARTALNRLYRNVPTDVALATPRRFSVHVSGAVPFPGRHALSAISRVEDALAQSTGTLAPRELADYTDVPKSEVERRPALRNVVVTSLEAREVRVDLMRYFATGDVTYNPPLDDGDTVYLPTFDPIREGVSVGGAVDRPGFYDWRPGDTAAALIEVAAGTGLGLRAGTVRRTRTADGQSQSVEVPLAEAASLTVVPRDQLYVVAADARAGFATAVGAVTFPGAYPIQIGSTTLRELVDAAGGLTSDALVRGAYVERSSPATPSSALDPFSDRRQPSAQTLDSTLTPLARLSPLGYVGRRYYIQEYVSTPRLSADLDGALDGSQPVLLREGDRLVVPRDLGQIRVFGQVGAPGYVAYQEGLSARDYVARAGGRAPAATDVYAVDARTGQFTVGDGTPILPGDAVFVDRTATGDQPASEQLAIQERQAEREDRREARESRYQFVQTIVSVTGTLLTALLVYNTFRQ